MKKTAHLSHREREVMDLVFVQGETILSQILEGMNSPPMRSILTILEGKGQLKHQQERREFIYQPVHSRAEVAELRRILDREERVRWGGGGGICRRKWVGDVAYRSAALIDV